MIETILLGITSFVGTNIDDLFLNALFFADARTTREKWQVVLGKYVGITILIGFSLLGAWGMQSLPTTIIRFAGLIPIVLGVKELVSNIMVGGTEECIEKGRMDKKFQDAALITIASGADNVGVYIPLFAGFSLWQLWTVIGIFFVMTAVCCYTGAFLAKLPQIKSILDKYKAFLVPLIYMVIGVYILLK